MMPKVSRACCTSAGSRKSVPAQEVRAGLSACKAVQQGFITLEMSLRGLLRNFGLKVGTISRGRFEQRIRERAAGNLMLEAATEPMLCARSALWRELAGLERHVQQLAQEDPVCRRWMSMPPLGPLLRNVLSGTGNWRCCSTDLSICGQ
jgi:transposase